MYIYICTYIYVYICIYICVYVYIAILTQGQDPWPRCSPPCLCCLTSFFSESPSLSGLFRSLKLGSLRTGTRAFNRGAAYAGPLQVASEIAASCGGPSHGGLVECGCFDRGHTC